MFELTIILTLTIVGYVVGQRKEKRHYKSIIKREAALINLVTTNKKKPLMAIDGNVTVKLVTGSVCISVDYFKQIVAGLRAFVGGNIRSYETLLDRARREAILRLKESCTDASEIYNLRFETSSIYKGSGKQIGSVEILAFATAIYK
ncbi:MAG: hypothetical protein ACI9IA_002341 [Enterobacterales bacterium]|jgi:uncharacterized protein YbjQ (UPF0145 family)